MTHEVQTILTRLLNVREKLSGDWAATCPVCLGPFLTIFKRGNSVNLFCLRGCESDDILDAIGFVDPRGSNYSEGEK